MHDIAIIGAGPAGLQGAIYCARVGKRTLLLDRGWEGPLLRSKIENYLGFPAGITGKELLEAGLKQALGFGVDFKRQEVIGVKKLPRGFELQAPLTSYKAARLVIATGKVIKPALKNEARFVGKGVSYCVACDGLFFKNKRVAVIGSRDLAAKEALELLNYNKSITIFTNGKEPAMAKRLKMQLAKNKIKIRKDRIAELAGDKVVKKLVLEKGEEAVEGVFMAVGFASSLDFARTLGMETRGIFLVVDKNQQTSVPGIYAAGDCTGPPFQIGKAIGEAVIAALNLIGKPVQY